MRKCKIVLDRRDKLSQAALRARFWEELMSKLVAIVCVISWSGFWAFGYLALSAGVEDSGQMAVAALLAAAGLFTGMVTWLRLARTPPRLMAV